MLPKVLEVFWASNEGTGAEPGPGGLGGCAFISMIRGSLCEITKSPIADLRDIVLQSEGQYQAFVPNKLLTYFRL